MKRIQKRRKNNARKECIIISVIVVGILLLVYLLTPTYVEHYQIAKVHPGSTLTTMIYRTDIKSSKIDIQQSVHRTIVENKLDGATIYPGQQLNLVVVYRK